MKYFYFLCVFWSIGALAQPKLDDTRTFKEINDSLMKEAGILYKFERSKSASEYYLQDHKKVKKNMGRIFVYEKQDTVYNLIISEKEPNKILYVYKYIDDYKIPTAEEQTERKLDSLETKLIETRDKIISDIQENYELSLPCRKCYYTPVFIPFKDQVGEQYLDLYKMYILVETEEPGEIPLGNDYLFYAKPDGTVFYWLKFNSFNPVPIQFTGEVAPTIEVDYPEREPYITPTDIFIFRKYAELYGLNNFKVNSTNLNIYFLYNAEKNFLQAFRAPTKKR